MRGGQRMYQYNMYCIGFSFRKTYMTLLAVPFLQMGREVFGIVNRRMRGMSLSYDVVNVDKLLNAILAKNHRGGRVKITCLDLLVYGDPNTNNLIIKGKDTVHSGIFERISKHRKGI